MTVVYYNMELWAGVGLSPHRPGFSGVRYCSDLLQAMRGACSLTAKSYVSIV